MNEPKNVPMPKTKGIRIEAPGCIVYLDHRAGGTIVSVVPDGTRFPGACMLGRTRHLVAGRHVDGEPTALCLSIVVENEQRSSRDAATPMHGACNAPSGMSSPNTGSNATDGSGS